MPRPYAHLSTREVANWFSEEIRGIECSDRALLAYGQLAPVSFRHSPAIWPAGLHENGTRLHLPTTTAHGYTAVRLSAIARGQTLFHVKGNGELHTFERGLADMWHYRTPMGDWLLPDYGWLLQEVSAAHQQVLRPDLVPVLKPNLVLAAA